MTDIELAVWSAAFVESYRRCLASTGIEERPGSPAEASTRASMAAAATVDADDAVIALRFAAAAIQWTEP